ncbi:unnamed protein product [Ilex paraguariensis]|uniref:Uncharacterized protein n=1 Tax=Ilex paraguariensis TaxID=185542 RepID=A0ABC8U0T9_9AQUA
MLPKLSIMFLEEQEVALPMEPGALPQKPTEALLGKPRPLFASALPRFPFSVTPTVIPASPRMLAPPSSITQCLGRPTGIAKSLQFRTYTLGVISCYSSGLGHIYPLIRWVFPWNTNHGILFPQSLSTVKGITVTLKEKKGKRGPYGFFPLEALENVP